MVLLHLPPPFCSRTESIARFWFDIPAQVVLFCIGAQSAIIAVLSLLLAAVSPRAGAHAVTLPWRGGRCCVVPTSMLVIAPLTAAAAIVWGTHRAASWAWTFQARFDCTKPRGCSGNFLRNQTHGKPPPDCLLLKEASPLYQNHCFPFLLQDLMGVCLVLSCLRGIRVNSLKARPLSQSRLQKIAFHASCTDSPFSIA